VRRPQPALLIDGGFGNAAQRFLDLQSQAIHAAPHIVSPDGQPDPHTRRNRESSPLQYVERAPI
jgi:hypothetical protein